ncbi:oxidoreductase (plasmid) [Legionella adelaidensis]|uniref:Oxidoreductase n=1 Tax=Legionella adelaidensis TaxID=45056 RepID=A0A0W0R2I2_9GAMM|nr:NAD(P)/FAD-dependent oxidoreductase [Legionella adelaidensis]KTC65308.1 oxidoreductase [Legionella adelaidensis]VEH86041.1 oxidoreductase [Legionella adelaidensis]
MKILIVGAGIAGLCLGALLKKRGLEPIIIEKASSLGDVGYMLGLYPIGANVLRALNCYDEYIAHSVPGETYEAYTTSGTLLKQFSFEKIVEQYGPYQLISRADLLKVIAESTDLAIRFNTEVLSLEQSLDQVNVTFSDKTDDTFDLVVGADGIHSHTRSLVLAESDYSYFKTGWGGWVWWGNENIVPSNTIREFWGNGTFLGIYPVKGKVGVIAAVDSGSPDQALKGASRKEYILQKFSPINQQHPEYFQDLPSDTERVFFWSLADQKASVWFKERILFIGDAATAFLPTAGVGASMALESAAVLDDILSRTGKEYIPLALRMFEKRRRKRVEATQKDSRKLAKLMFVNKKWQVMMRDSFTKYMSVESLIKSIIKGFDEPI